MKMTFVVFLFAARLSIASALGADSPQSVPAAYSDAARQAKEQFDRGNYEEAEKIYESILTAAPNNLYVLSNLGVVRFRGGKLKLAAKAFRQAIAIAPNDAFSQRTLGIVYCSQNRYDDAIKSLRRAIALDPKSATAHNYLGIAYSQKGMQRKAAREWDIARELDPAYKEPDKLPEEIPTEIPNKCRLITPPATKRSIPGDQLFQDPQFWNEVKTDTFPNDDAARRSAIL